MTDSRRFELTVREKDGNLRRYRQRPADAGFLLSRQDVIDFVRRLIPRRRARPLRSALALVWLLFPPLAARAQLPPSPLEDATVLRPAAIRFGGFFDFASATERFGENTPGRREGQHEPLLIDYTVNSLGVINLPRLATFEDDIRGASGLASFDLSLGQPIVQSDVGIATLPISLEVGITSRLMVGFTVPYVKTRNTLSYDLTDGTVGINPGLVAGPARTANTLFIDQITDASGDLATALDFCSANPSSGICPNLNANRAQAEALIDESLVLRDQIERVYGSATATNPSPVVPRIGSAAQTAIDTRATTMSALYRSLLGLPAEPITARPFGAPTPVTGLQVQGIVRTDAEVFGIAARGLESSARSHVGDMEAGAKLLVVDGLREGRGFRMAVAGAYRFATGREDDPDDFFDIPTGDGQNDIDVASFVDLGLGGRFILSARGRYTIQLPDETIARITDAPNQILPPAYRRQTVERDLGDIVELEATPRFGISRYFSVIGQYTFRRRGADDYTGQFTIPGSVTGIGDVDLDASTLGLETESIEHRVGLGFTFSTLHAPRTRWPIEIGYLHGVTVDGTGNALSVTRDVIQIRIYTPGAVR